MENSGKSTGTPGDEINRLINQELQDWSGQVMARLLAALREKKVVLTQELLRSLHTEVVQAAADNRAQMLLYFEYYGRLKDMRKLSWSQNPPIEAMRAFVEKEGLSKFAYVPGYEKSKRVPTESVAINRIAWGIVKNWRRAEPPPPKRWFNRTFYGQINFLLDRIVTRYQATTGQVMGAAISDGL